MKDWEGQARTEAHYQYSEEQFNAVARVIGSVKASGGTWLDCAVTWLHLLPEIGITAQELWWEGFPVEVVDALEALTRNPDERAADYYDRVRANETALFSVFHILDSSPSWMGNMTIRELFKI